MRQSSLELLSHHPFLISLSPAHMVVNSPIIKLPSCFLFEYAVCFLLDPWLPPCPGVYSGELHFVQVPSSLWDFPGCPSFWESWASTAPFQKNFLQHSWLFIMCLPLDLELLKAGEWSLFIIIISAPGQAHHPGLCWIILFFWGEKGDEVGEGMFGFFFIQIMYF